jgi:hypothetical protein
MNEMQRFLVADHIEHLEREASARRLERAVRADMRIAAPARARARLGHLLVSVGVAVAGRSPAAVSVRVGRAAGGADVTPTATVSRPCTDDPAPLPRAA